MKRKLVTRAKCERITARLRGLRLLINQGFRDLGVCRRVLIPSIQLKAGNLIHGTEIERMKARSVIRVLPVDGEVVAALLVAYQESRIGRHVNPPIYGQSIAVGVRSVVR